jgi:hypothetical protein
MSMSSSPKSSPSKRSPEETIAGRPEAWWSTECHSVEDMIILFSIDTFEGVQSNTAVVLQKRRKTFLLEGRAYSMLEWQA